MKKYLLIVFCIIMCVMCMAAYGCSLGDGASGEGEVDEEEYDDNYSDGALNEGDEAPDFTAELVGGEKFTLSEHKDDVVLINFWATWCGYCVNEMPDIQRLKDDDISGLHIIEVNCVEARDTVDEFVKENGYTMDFAYDENGSITTSYPTQYLPCTVIVKDGIAKKIIQGAPRDAYDMYKAVVMECIQS